jgi:Na+/H+ antiporter NhaD/arsenite permease-like protein
MILTRERVILFSLVLGGVLMYFLNVYHDVFEHVKVLPVTPWMIAPFVLFLFSIAVMPFINRHWWERHYPKASFGLGAATLLYYVFVVDNIPRILATFHEYVSFISLIGSLFVVAGGISIRIRGKAAPWENVTLLAVGAVISNFLGTTGASMLLIRPYLRINKYRIKPYHVVFFIFIVSNIGGALTPIGDPPLFLGYLNGIPFFWIISRVWHIWLLVLACILLVFYMIDSHYFHKETTEEQLKALKPDEPHASGLHNVFFLLVILIAVFIEHPLMLREVVMWLAAIGSYYTTKKEVHERNEFNFIPINEVAILFAGIFATMIPALDWLELNSETLGVVTIGQYFWGTGILSSFLDNAPTYLNFLSAAFGLHGAHLGEESHMLMMLGAASAEQFGLTNPLEPDAFEITSATWRYVQSISLAAVFFGACTYIGNGPNFMVKSIAEQSKIQMPSFFGYIVNYTIPILIPIFTLVWFLFFRS